jgi:Holliday junction resolvasome RuvABC endonuclease subunit
MFYLGIDQSFSSCGLVVLGEEGQMIHYRIIQSDPKESVFRRSWSILAAIRETVEKFRINYVAIEGLALSMKGNATRSLAILQGVVVTNLLFDPPSDNQLEEQFLEIITPSQLKKFATGRGKASKDEMIAALPGDLQKEWQERVNKKSRDDLADAYFLACHVRQYRHRLGDYRLCQKSKPNRAIKASRTPKTADRKRNTKSNRSIKPKTKIGLRRKSGENSAVSSI